MLYYTINIVIMKNTYYFSKQVNWNWLAVYILVKKFYILV